MAHPVDVWERRDLCCSSCGSASYRRYDVCRAHDSILIWGCCSEIMIVLWDSQDKRAVFLTCVCSPRKSKVQISKTTRRRGNGSIFILKNGPCEVSSLPVNCAPNVRTRLLTRAPYNILPLAPYMYILPRTFFEGYCDCSISLFFSCVMLVVQCLVGGRFRVIVDDS